MEYFFFQLSRAKRRGVRKDTDPPTQDVFLIPELCSMTGLTDFMRADRRVMQDLAQFTRVNPIRRIQDARKHLSALQR